MRKVCCLLLLLLLSAIEYQLGISVLALLSFLEIYSIFKKKLVVVHCLFSALPPQHFCFLIFSLSCFFFAASSILIFTIAKLVVGQVKQVVVFPPHTRFLSIINHHCLLSGTGQTDGPPFTSFPNHKKTKLNIFAKPSLLVSLEH